MIDLCFVLFLVCLYVCVCACLLQNYMRMYTSKNIHVSEVHCGSSVRFGQALPDYLITAHHLYASLTWKEHISSIHVHNHLDVVTSLWCDSKIGPVRVNHKVSTTGDGTRNQGDVEISNFPISLRNGLVIDVSFVCEFKGISRDLGGGKIVCAILMTSYRPVPRSRTTSTRTSMGSQSVCTYHHRYVWSDPRWLSLTSLGSCWQTVAVVLWEHGKGG